MWSNLAINYGSKNEILNALKKTKKKITLKNFEKNLYFNNIPKSRYSNSHRWPQKVK